MRELARGARTVGLPSALKYATTARGAHADVVNSQRRLSSTGDTSSLPRMWVGGWAGLSVEGVALAVARRVGWRRGATVWVGREDMTVWVGREDMTLWVGRQDMTGTQEGTQGGTAAEEGGESSGERGRGEGRTQQRRGKGRGEGRERQRRGKGRGEGREQQRRGETA
eukprot:363582-Chlamydomonas_euryale.AAC.3